MSWRQISGLERHIDRLSAADRSLAKRIFRVCSMQARCKCPDSMKDWVVSRFGSVAAVESQTIARVENLWTGEAALFNPLRAQRPRSRGRHDILKLTTTPEEGQACHFCRVLEMTPADAFGGGRIQGNSCVTASNTAKFEGTHGLIVFHKHDPTDFSRDELLDWLWVANRWFQEAVDIDEEAIYPFVFWNCRWRAGASLEHGHMQLTLASHRHYPRIENLRRAAQEYLQTHGTSYFEDLFQVHRSLGLAFSAHSAKVLVSLTPLRDKEVWIIGESLDGDLGSSIFSVLDALRGEAGVEAFNVGILLPPVVPRAGWHGFPVVVRILDRQSVAELPSDISALHLFAGIDAIASDPYAVMRAFAPLQAKLPE